MTSVTSAFGGLSRKEVHDLFVDIRGLQFCNRSQPFCLSGESGCVYTRF
jgi:hypothetical protein